MLTNYLVRTILTADTGLPSDAFVNDWCVQGDETSGPAMLDAFDDFFNLADGPFILCGALSDLVDHGEGIDVQVYEIDLPSGELGSPVAVTNLPFFTASTGDPLPPEVALCTSFAANTPPGVNPQRCRGRVYLGPFTEGHNGGGRPSSDLVIRIRNITKRLDDALIGAGATLAVWSRADHAVRPVVRGWVDNEWDTQRRRGREATSRNTWTPL